MFFLFPLTFKFKVTKILVFLVFLGFSFSCTQLNKEEIIYARINGAELKGDLWVPPGKKNVPIVFVVHGGSWNSRDKEDMDHICEALVKKGFAAFNLNYRLASEAPFPAPIEDFKTAVLHLKQLARRYHLDFSRLAAWGYSAGAQVAVLGALELEDKVEFKALISGAGPMNLTLYPKNEAVKQYLKADFKRNPQVFYEASPYYFVNAKTPPMFFYHSKRDKTVYFKHTKVMSEKLEANHVPYDVYEVPWLNHFFTFVFSFESIDRSIEFLETHLK